MAYGCRGKLDNLLTAVLHNIARNMNEDEPTNEGNQTEYYIAAGEILHIFKIQNYNSVSNRLKFIHFFRQLVDN